MWAEHRKIRLRSTRAIKFIAKARAYLYDLANSVTDFSINAAPAHNSSREGNQLSDTNERPA